MKNFYKKKMGIVFLVVLSLFYVESSGQKPKTRTIQKKVSKSIYDEKPFDLTSTSLKNYNGHDPMAIYNALQKRNDLLKRGEFESINSFLDRVKNTEKQPFLSQLSQFDYLAFVADPYLVTYEILNYKLEVYTVGTINNYEATLRTEFQSEKTIQMQNAFGAVFDVRSTFSKSWGVFINEEDREECNSCFRVTTSFHLMPEDAQRIKKNVKVLFIGKTVFPFCKQSITGKSASLTSPSESITTEYQIILKPELVVLFDYETGDILHKKEYKTVMLSQ